MMADIFNLMKARISLKDLYARPKWMKMTTKLINKSTNSILAI